MTALNASEGGMLLRTAADIRVGDILEVEWTSAGKLATTTVLDVRWTHLKQDQPENRLIGCRTLLTIVNRNTATDAAISA